VSQFRHLVSLISEDDIAQKIFGAELIWEKVFIQKKKLLTGKVNLGLKKRRMKIAWFGV